MWTDNDHSSAAKMNSAEIDGHTSPVTLGSALRRRRGRSKGDRRRSRRILDQYKVYGYARSLGCVSCNGLEGVRAEGADVRVPIEATIIGFQHGRAYPAQREERHGHDKH